MLPAAVPAAARVPEVKGVLRGHLLHGRGTHARKEPRRSLLLHNHLRCAEESFCRRKTINHRERTLCITGGDFRISSSPSGIGFGGYMLGGDDVPIRTFSCATVGLEAGRDHGYRREHACADKTPELVDGSNVLDLS